MYTHTRARPLTRTHTHTHTHARIHPHTHAHTRTRTHTHTHARIHPHTHAHTHTRTHTHTHTHTHTRGRPGDAAQYGPSPSSSSDRAASRTAVTCRTRGACLARLDSWPPRRHRGSDLVNDDHDPAAPPGRTADTCAHSCDATNGRRREISHVRRRRKKRGRLTQRSNRPAPSRQSSGLEPFRAARTLTIIPTSDTRCEEATTRAQDPFENTPTATAWSPPRVVLAAGFRRGLGALGAP